MSEAPLITAEGLGKRFTRDISEGSRALGRELTALFWGARKRVSVEERCAFWALRDVTFSLRRGEVLGVIGHNGAGKTTLLRILNSELPLDEGKLKLTGSRGSLIDLTGGFSATMTGRENIYYRGAHLGFDRDFLLSKEAEIVEFAGLAEFIDAPIKTYSTGMLLRLGFAVTVFAEPDVLLVDEILAVGDFLFAAKCMRKMNDIKRRAAIVFVTHDTAMALHFADKVLVLDRGQPSFLGAPATAIEHYMRLEESKEERGERLARNLTAADALIEDVPQNIEAPTPESPDAANAAVTALEGADVVALEARMGSFIYNTDAIGDVDCHWCDADGLPVTSVEGGRRTLLRLSFIAREPLHRLAMGVPIWSSDGVYVTCFATHGRPIEHEVRRGTRHVITLDVEAMNFNKGAYYPVIALLNGGEFLYRQPGPVLRIASSPALLSWGLVTFPYDWRQINESGASAAPYAPLRESTR